MSEFMKLSEERYSVRKFSDRKVSDEIINDILRAAQIAPTACNNQPQIIYVVKSEDGLAKLCKCKRSNYGEQLAFIVCYDKNKCWKREFDGALSGEVDCSIVTTHMMLEGWEKGVGSTWVMHFIPEAVRAEFEIPENIIPVAILEMGYAADDAAPSPRHATYRDLGEMVITC